MAFRKHQDKVRSRKDPRKKLSKEDPRDGNACKLCKELDPKVLALLEKAWLVEGIAARDLALKFDLPLDRVEQHVKRCLVNVHRSRYERLIHVFDQLYTAVDIAHDSYVDKPTNFNASSYQGLAHALRGVLQDLNALQNAEETAEDLVSLALNPMISKLTHAIISESANLKDTLMSKFDEDEADNLINDYVERLGQLFKDATVEAHKRLENVLSAKDRNRNKTLKGGSNSSSRFGKLEVVSSS